MTNTAVAIIARDGKMLRRLGLTKAPATAENGGTKDVVVASRPDPYLATRFFKVVHRGGVAVRASPAEPAPEGGQVSAIVVRVQERCGADMQPNATGATHSKIRTAAVSCTQQNQNTCVSIGDYSTAAPVVLLYFW